MIEIIPNSKKTSAEVINCNLSKLNQQELEVIRSALEKYGMIYFRNQNLSSYEYLSFAKKIGKPAKYPRLKGLNKKYPEITVVERKTSDKGPSFGEQFHTDSSYTKKPPSFTMLLSKRVPRPGKANTEFSSQYLAYKKLPKKYKYKLNKLTGIFSSNGPIAITTVERTKEKGKLKKELKAKHKVVKVVGGKKTIYCSPGHLVGFSNNNVNFLKLRNYLLKHQTKKSFQYSLKWHKNQLAIWDNRSMLHQATPFKGNRVMHRITIQ